MELGVTISECLHAKLFTVQHSQFQRPGYNFYLQNQWALAGVALLVGALSHGLKDYRFNSQAEHMPRLWVRSLVGMCRRRQPIKVSHLSLSPSLPFLPFSLKAMNMSSGEVFLKKGFLTCF